MIKNMKSDFLNYIHQRGETVSFKNLGSVIVKIAYMDQIFSHDLKQMSS